MEEYKGSEPKTILSLSCSLLKDITYLPFIEITSGFEICQLLLPSPPLDSEFLHGGNHVSLIILYLGSNRDSST